MKLRVRFLANSRQFNVPASSFEERIGASHLTGEDAGLSRGFDEKIEIIRQILQIALLANIAVNELTSCSLNKDDSTLIRAVLDCQATI